MKRGIVWLVVIIVIAGMTISMGCKLPEKSVSSDEMLGVNDIPVPLGFTSKGLEKNHVVAAVSEYGNRRFNTVLHFKGSMSIENVKKYYISMMPNFKWHFNGERTIGKTVVLIFENKWDVAFITIELGANNLTYITMRIDARE